MDHAKNEASAWRIELARKLAPRYASHPSIRMIVLGGSPVRGLSDEWSDLDVVLYWDALDRGWIETAPLAPAGGERRLLAPYANGAILIEHYFFDSVKVDMCHVTLEKWEEWADDVQLRFDTTPFKQKTIAGFLGALPLHGEALCREWRDRLSAYPPELGRRMVEAHLRFFVRGCLLHQGWDRRELLFFHDGLSEMAKNLLAVVAGLNRVYFSRDEPRWLAWELERMPVKPDRFLERIEALFRSEPREAVERLENLIADTYALVEERMGAVDVEGRRRRREVLAVEGCRSKPKTLP